MRCPKCRKDSLIIQYRVFSAVKDCYLNTLEQAEDRYKELKTLLPSRNWKIGEIKACNNCEYIKTKDLKYKDV